MHAEGTPAQLRRQAPGAELPLARSAENLLTQAVGTGAEHARGIRDFGASINELQAVLLGSESIDGSLRELAARTLGQGLSCGITLHPNGPPLTVASSDANAAQVDELQYSLDNGPCLTTLRTGEEIVDDLSADRAGGADDRVDAVELARSPAAGPAVFDRLPAGADDSAHAAAVAEWSRGHVGDSHGRVPADGLGQRLAEAGAVGHVDFVGQRDHDLLIVLLDGREPLAAEVRRG